MGNLLRETPNGKVIYIVLNILGLKILIDFGSIDCLCIVIILFFNLDVVWIDLNIKNINSIYILN